MTPNLINLCAGVSKKLVAGEIELNCHVKFGCVKFQRCRKSRWNYTANVKEPRWRWNHGHHKNNAVFGFGLTTISLGAALAILQAAWHSSKTRSAECKKQEFTTNRKQHVPAHIGDCAGLFRITQKNHKSKIALGFFPSSALLRRRVRLRQTHSTEEGPYHVVCIHPVSGVRGPSPWSDWNKPTIPEQVGDQKKKTAANNMVQVQQTRRNIYKRFFFAFHCLKMFSALVCSAALFGLAMLPPEHNFKIRMWHTGNFCQLLVCWMKKNGKDWSIV